MCCRAVLLHSWKAPVRAGPVVLTQFVSFLSSCRPPLEVRSPGEHQDFCRTAACSTLKDLSAFLTSPAFFLFNSETYARTISHCFCSTDCSIHIFNRDVRVSLQRFIFGDRLRTCNRGCIDVDHAWGHDWGISLLALGDSYTCTHLSPPPSYESLGPSHPLLLLDSQCFVFRDRTRLSIMGSRLSIWRCESLAPGELSDFRLSDDPTSRRMVSALTNTVFSEISGFESAWFSYCLPVLSGPSDLPDCHPARWMRGWLSAHGDVDSLLGPAASLEAFQPSELPVRMQAWTVALQVLQVPHSRKTVFALSDVDCLSNLLPPVILFLDSSCLYIIGVFEDLHIQTCSSAPVPECESREPGSAPRLWIVRQDGSSPHEYLVFHMFGVCLCLVFKVSASVDGT